ncbi:MAG: type II toxin-antitoxin system VapC family toxin [Moorellales bacterium]
MAYLIDTCVFIDHLRGRLTSSTSAWLERVAASGEALTSVVVLHELLFGARTPKAQGVVTALLSAWEVLPVDRRTAELAAELRRQEANRGITVGMADSLIAATALVYGLVVVTGNVKDFGAVAVVSPEEVAR